MRTAHPHVAKCGPVQGEAHFILSIANSCSPTRWTAGPWASAMPPRADAEVSAMKTCDAKEGREFVRCVRAEIKASPMGH